jgi:hypothetical protein
MGYPSSPSKICPIQRYEGGPFQPFFGLSGDFDRLDLPSQ